MRTLAALAIIGLALGIACGMLGAPIELTAVSLIFGIAMLFAFGHAVFEALRTEAPEPYDIGEETPHVAPAAGERALGRKNRGTVPSKENGAF